MSGAAGKGMSGAAGKGFQSKHEPDQWIWIGVRTSTHERSNMYAVIRNYSGAGAKKLFDLLEERKADVESAIRKVPGLKSYTLLRSGDGGISVTVCQDKTGADESLKVAREWIQNNAADTGVGPPAVTEGSVIVQI